MMVVIMALLGSLLYRHRGAAYKYKKWFPRPFNQIGFALPYCFVCFPPNGDSYWVAALVLALTTMGVLTGRGNFFNNDSYGSEPETLEFPILWLKDRIPLKLYKFLGMSIVGMAHTMPAGITTLNPLLAISGLLMAFSYFVTKDTRVSEYLTGGLLWGSLAIFAAYG